MGSKNGISGREVQYNAEISRRVEEMRLERKVTKADMARAMDIAQPMLRNYETGMTRWPVYRVAQIAAYFGVGVDELMPEKKTCVNETCNQTLLRLR